eukprot:CAMPEP_0119479010 /NCGR_PEP_ID=MMETSP1344-20130328/8480_1 /TAXON_ID=236787 /ORGANISM="Florenciella parvula, Strain CCMP2471" /LENGTH=49 /DNA_ID=CAMNT_0007513221 /DNA_START=256 /DNA_END=404 /DNA_ORIENTATION=+
MALLSTRSPNLHGASAPAPAAVPVPVPAQASPSEEFAALVAAAMTVLSL